MLIGQAIGYEHDNGQVVFSQLNFSLQNHKYALVGQNGVGKTTLALMMAKQLKPTSGRLQSDGVVYYLPQFENAPPLTVGEYLNDLWQAPTDRQLLAQSLLSTILFEQSLSSLSGGEWTRVRIAKALSSAWDFLIMDEPTNNLDAQARGQVRDFIAQANLPLLVISHDRMILREVDEILELSSTGLQIYGGNLEFYLDQRKHEKSRERSALDHARADKKRRERQKTEKIQTQEKRSRTASNKAADAGIPKILLGARKRQAQATSGKIQSQNSAYVDQSLEKFQQAFEEQKKEKLLYFRFPETSVPEGKLIFACEDFNFRFHQADQYLWTQNLNFVLKGPERMAIKGGNGTGKTTFLRLLLGHGEIAEGKTIGKWQTGNTEVAFIDQSYKLLDFQKTVFENVIDSSRFDQIETRNLLARFLFTGEQVHQKVSTLSGGQKLKAALAKALLQSPAPQLLILDEPTNNLDLASLEFLENALKTYEGALLVVSHDEDFLANIQVRAVSLTF